MPWLDVAAGIGLRVPLGTTIVDGEEYAYAFSTCARAWGIIIATFLVWAVLLGSLTLHILKVARAVPRGPPSHDSGASPI